MKCGASDIFLSIFEYNKFFFMQKTKARFMKYFTSLELWHFEGDAL